MAKVVLSERFGYDIDDITSERIPAWIKSNIEYAALFPQIGSQLIPQRAKKQFGDSSRRIGIPPFDLYYTYDQETDTITVEGMVHQRQGL